MTSSPALPALILALATAFAAPAGAASPSARSACPEGQVRVHDQCVAACPIGKGFDAPAACECPAGHGKVLLGSGGGECRRLVCKPEAAVDPKLCDCPEGFTRKPLRKGKVQCTRAVASAPAR